MTLEKYKAKIEYDPEIDMFRGEILGINGGADFYAKTTDGLRQEFKNSLEVFLQVCKEKKIKPRKEFSGKLHLRISPRLHEKIEIEAVSKGKSLNQWISDYLYEIVTPEHADNGMEKDF